MLTQVINLSMINLQLFTCTFMRSWLKVVEKGVFLFLNLKNISFQLLVS